MRKQTALLLSTLVLMTAVSMQPANAFSLKFWHKKTKPAVVAPVKEPAKITPAAKPAVAPAAKPVSKSVATPAAKPVAKPAVKAPAKK